MDDGDVRLALAAREAVRAWEATRGGGYSRAQEEALREGLQRLRNVLRDVPWNSLAWSAVGFLDAWRSWEYEGSGSKLIDLNSAIQRLRIEVGKVLDRKDEVQATMF